MRPNYLLLFTFILLMACNGSKYTPTDYPNETITFGYSGGIANMTTEYSLLSNGQLFKKIDAENFEALPKVKSQQCDQLFKNIDFLGFKTMNLKDPGNKTNFIRIKDKGGVSEIAWGGTLETPSNEVKVFFSTLMNLVKQEK